MNSVPVLPDHAHFLPDSPNVTSLKCSVPQVLPTESMRSCSSLWKFTVLSPQTILSSKDSCQNALKTSNWNNVQSLPLPSISRKAGPDQESMPDTESSQPSLPDHDEDIKVYKDANKQ